MFSDDGGVGTTSSFRVRRSRSSRGVLTGTTGLGAAARRADFAGFARFLARTGFLAAFVAFLAGRRAAGLRFGAFLPAFGRRAAGFLAMGWVIPRGRHS